MAEPILVQRDDGRLTYRLRGAEPGDRLAVVLLHGLTGDERVMWVLEDALPDGSLIVAPRGPFDSVEGGYSWLANGRRTEPSLADFEPGVASLVALLDEVQADHGLDRRRLLFVGFSQGAALAFAAAARPESRPAGVAALAGFVPHGDLAGLAGLPVFWGHGSRDPLVPIRRAREGAARLRAAAVQVEFCESDVGHKLGAECLRGLRSWVRQTFPGLSES